MNQRESSVISVLRYPLAVLVIMCHSSLFTLLDKVHLPGSESWNVLNGLQVFFSETIIHVAVPLFMLFSGMLFFRKGLPNSAGYAKTLKKKVRTLLVPYLIWSTFCFFTAVADGLVSPTPLHWLQGLWDTALWQPGTTFNINLPGYPMSMPLWFLRNLMILMALTPAIGWLLSKTHGWFLLLPAIWWFPAHAKFFGFGADSLFYFTLGAWISLGHHSLLRWVNSHRLLTYIASIVTMAVMFYFVYTNFLQTHQIDFRWIPFNIFVVCGMAATLNIASWLVDSSHDKPLLRLSDSSFWLFAAHFIFLSQLQRWLWNVIYPNTELGNIVFYFGFMIAYIPLLTVAYYLLRPLCPKLMSILTGGR